MSDIVGKKVIAIKKLSKGTTAIVQMTDTMYAVYATGPDGTVLISRNFVFTEDLKKIVLKDCRTFYKALREHLIKGTIDMLLEDDSE